MIFPSHPPEPPAAGGGRCLGEVRGRALGDVLRRSKMAVTSCMEVTCVRPSESIRVIYPSHLSESVYIYFAFGAKRP